MDFRIDATLPASAAQLWAIFFDVQRIAKLIPGCENVAEVEPLKAFSALMKQKIGPFKLEIPTVILLGSYTFERYVELSATGRDKLTGTTVDVRMKVNLDERNSDGNFECTLGVDAEMQVAGRLASLGYPVVKKRSEELFAEFERRLRNELVGFSEPTINDTTSAIGPVPSTVPVNSFTTEAIEPIGTAPLVGVEPAKFTDNGSPASEARVLPAHAAVASNSQNGLSPQQNVPAPRSSRGVELVLQWPRVGINVAVACVVAYAATTAFDQSPGWWFVAPMLGFAAGFGRRSD